jgi:very-short-patch-repair endonuclease
MNKKHNPNLTGHSQRLRREMTKEERHLWYDFLKGLPVTFHRQKVIGQYIVDFYCASAKLVIELDGSQHFDAEGIAADAARDKYLNELGLIVRRYSNAEINQDFESVCLDIHNTIFPDNFQTHHSSL